MNLMAVYIGVLSVLAILALVMISALLYKPKSLPNKPQ